MINLKKKILCGLQQFVYILHRFKRCKFIDVIFVIAILQLLFSFIYLANETFNPKKTEKSKIKITRMVLNTSLYSDETANEWPTIYSNLSAKVKLMNTKLGLRFVEVVSYGNRRRNGRGDMEDKTVPCPLLSPYISKYSIKFNYIQTFKPRLSNFFTYCRIFVLHYSMLKYLNFKGILSIFH